MTVATVITLVSVRSRLGRASGVVQRRLRAMVIPATPEADKESTSAPTKWKYRVWVIWSAVWIKQD